MSEEILKNLHDAVGKLLLARVASGEASPSDISNAIKFLKDNGINCDGGSNPVLNDLTDALPGEEELEDMFNR